MNSFVVVPARLASSRLPNKPLALIDGVPMIVRVLQRVSNCQAKAVVAAVDHQDVFDVVQQAGFDAVMTDPSHQSGSDRVMEVANKKGWQDSDIVINVQGDEPLMPPEVVDQITSAMRHDNSVGMATLSEPIANGADFGNPNIVKVVVDRSGNALYFSRAPIPYPRDAGVNIDEMSRLELAQLTQMGIQRHVGVYGFRVSALRTFVGLHDSNLEKIEMLEQLRWLEAGHKLRVLASERPIPGGVDTPEDLQHVEQLIVAARDG